MFNQIFLAAVVAVTLTFAPLSVKAQTLSLTEAVARMNTIIAEMEKLRTEFSNLAATVGQSAPKPAVLGAQTSPVFTMSLAYGQTNDDIGRIQKLLASDPEIYPEGTISGFFGPKTQEAIRNLQTRFGLDPVGVVGPATTALLEAFMRAYPSGEYPAGALKQKPQVAGVSVSTPTTPVSTPTYTGSNPARLIKVSFSDGEALIEVQYTNGNRNGFVADTTDKDEVVSFIASRTVLTEAQIRQVIDFNGRSDDDDEEESEDSDEGDAESALDDAEDAIDDAEEAIEEAEEEGEDTDWAEETLDDAIDAFEDAEEAFDDEDYDEAVDLAREAEDLAKDAEDRIDEEEDSNGGDSDEIEKIEVEVGDGESDVTVEYEDGSDEDFSVEEDKEDSIIEAVADELNIDEDEVEDLIEFDYGDVSHIEVRIDDDSSLARIFYDKGAEKRLRLSETDEDDIIEAIASEIDEDEEDIEDWIDFL